MQRFCWYSKALDLESPNRKTLTELRINVSSPIELTIEGDFGNKIIQLDEGLNVKKLNLTSRTFSLNANKRTNEFSIQDLSFKYLVLEG